MSSLPLLAQLLPTSLTLFPQLYLDQLGKCTALSPQSPLPIPLNPIPERIEPGKRKKISKLRKFEFIQENVQTLAKKCIAQDTKAKIKPSKPFDIIADKLVGDKSALVQWYLNHLDDPHPTYEEKVKLAELAQMDIIQVSTWFSNERRRNHHLYQEASADLENF